MHDDTKKLLEHIFFSLTYIDESTVFGRIRDGQYKKLYEHGSLWNSLLIDFIIGKDKGCLSLFF